MLGCKAIDKFASLVERIGNENGAGMFDGDARHTEGNSPSCQPISRWTSRAKEREVVTKKTGGILGVFGLGQQIGGDPARIAFGRQHNRLGCPAGRSIAQSPLTNCLAAVTYLLPGPNIFSTRGIERVP